MKIRIIKDFGFRGRRGKDFEVLEELSNEEFLEELKNYGDGDTGFIDPSILPDIIKTGKYRAGKEAVEMWQGNVEETRHYFNSLD